MAEKSQRGANLSREDRARGGRTSAGKQRRDERGQFAGTNQRKTASRESELQSQSHGRSITQYRGATGDVGQEI